MAGCWQPHNMHTCNWEVVLLVKWKNTSVITNCCCNWQDLLIWVVELAGNLEIIWTLSQSPELYCAIRQASHPSSHRIGTLLSWPRSSSHCRRERGVVKNTRRRNMDESINLYGFVYVLNVPEVFMSMYNHQTQWLLLVFVNTSNNIKCSLFL